MNVFNSHALLVEDVFAFQVTYEGHMRNAFHRKTLKTKLMTNVGVDAVAVAGG